MNLICQSCGKNFTHSRNKAYCDDCVKSADTEARICLRCHHIFYVEKYDKYHYKKQLYCDSCSKQETKTLVCQRCGKEFQVGKYPGTDSFIKRKYCSDSCARSVPTKTSICKTCGKEFELKRTKDGHFIPNLYCSRDCRLKSQREKLDICKDSRQDKIKQTCQERYGVDYSCLLPQCIEANPVAKSKTNDKFAVKLQEANIEFVQEYRIGSYVYDFYLPDNDILVEINPTFTHTCIDTIAYHGKDRFYHVNKTTNALPKHCIHVWDWDNLNSIVKLLSPKQHKVYARNLSLKEVTKEDSKVFLNKYHLQGKCRNNTVNVALLENDEIVQIMTFGKPRYNKNYEWELLRLCTHSDYYVVGGSERIFNYFVKTYSPTNIISYCDKSKFSGDVYKRLGFSVLKDNSPSKHWSKKTSHITDNLLRQHGFDQLFHTNYGKGTDNEELMLENGWLPIYDCGQTTYLINFKEIREC